MKKTIYRAYMIDPETMKQMSGYKEFESKHKFLRHWLALFLCKNKDVILRLKVIKQNI
jgi:hypothetical protein